MATCRVVGAQRIRFCAQRRYTIDWSQCRQCLNLATSPGERRFSRDQRVCWGCTPRCGRRSVDKVRRTNEAAVARGLAVWGCLVDVATASPSHSRMHSSLLFCLAAFAPFAAAWAPSVALPTTRAAVSTRSALLNMQIATPDAPTKEPSTLPESWTVPDTFVFPKTQAQEQPMFKVTLFKSCALLRLDRAPSRFCARIPPCPADNPQLTISRPGFAAADVPFVTKAIMSVVGYDEERSADIAEKAHLAG